jgi:8-oxo-dGTP pyrophosphatase MutT (NUDIX family)
VSEGSAAEFAVLARKLHTRLARPLPGHPGLRAPDTAAPWRAAAVLVLVFPAAEGPSTVLTLRSADLRAHAGQVSFPGGALEEQETAVTAALREAREEIGFEGRAEPMGALSPVFVPPTRYLLEPVVAVTHEQPIFTAAPAEVSQVVQLPLHTLVAPGRIQLETRAVAGAMRRMPFLDAGEHRVWGATALILSELADVWRDVVAAAGTRKRPRV